MFQYWGKLSDNGQDEPAQKKAQGLLLRALIPKHPPSVMTAAHGEHPQSLHQRAIDLCEIPKQQTSALLDVWVSGSLHLWISALLDLWTSGSLGLSVSRALDLTETVTPDDHVVTAVIWLRLMCEAAEEVIPSPLLGEAVLRFALHFLAFFDYNPQALCAQRAVVDGWVAEHSQRRRPKL